MINLDALCKIQYGMYVITSKKDDAINGQIATTVTQVTNEPIQISACISKETLTHEYIQHSHVFGASILDQHTDIKFIGHFGFRSGREINKFENIHYEKGLTGCPLVTDNALVLLEVTVLQSIDLNTHTVFIGELQSTKRLRDGDAMTYEYYHTVIKGKSPKNAPTYVCKD